MIIGMIVEKASSENGRSHLSPAVNSNPNVESPPTERRKASLSPISTVTTTTIDLQDSMVHNNHNHSHK